jgi:hypothetical protein
MPLLLLKYDSTQRCQLCAQLKRKRAQCTLLVVSNVQLQLPCLQVRKRRMEPNTDQINHSHRVTYEWKGTKHWPRCPGCNIYLELSKAFFVLVPVDPTNDCLFAVTSKTYALCIVTLALLTNLPKY